MSRVLFRYVLRTYAVFVAGIGAAMLTIYLVVDFVDRAHSFRSPTWVQDAAELYANRAMVVLQQLGPAILLLGAGAAVSSLRKRGEVTAMGALGFGPRALYLPVLLASLLAAVGLTAFEELVVVRASLRAEQIQVEKFDHWGDWRFYFQPKQWFRRGEWVLFLRGGDPEKGFEDVTLLRLSKDFDLLERVDAGKMEFVSGTTWKLTDVMWRAFKGSTSPVQHLPERVMDLGVEHRALRIRPGRPEQMRVPQLHQQIAVRSEVGLPTAQFVLELQNRFSYPVTGIAASLLAVALALRPNRKGHLTAAMVEGLVVAVLLWGTMVVCKALVLSDRLPAPLAAWLPAALLSGIAAWRWIAAEAPLAATAAEAPLVRSAA